MRISESGLIYKLSVLFNDYDPRDFCHLCRRLLINGVALIVLSAVAVFLVSDLIASLLVFVIHFTFFWTPSIVVLAVTAFGIVTALILFVPPYMLSENPTDSESIDFIKTLYAKKKHNFCPNLEIEQ